MNSLNRFADPIYCVMRLIVGLTFACHGAQKLLGWFPNPKQPAGTLDTLDYISGGIELIGGVLIAIGLLTRVAAFLSSGLMAAAYFNAHWPFVFTPIAKAVPLVNRGELAVVYCWLFLFIFFYGPGRWAVDAMMRRGSSTTTTTPTV